MASWEISGYVIIPRTDPNATSDMQLPFTVYWPFDPNDPAGGFPSYSDIEPLAKQIAVNFLDMLQDSDPKHRKDYGEMGGVVVTSYIIVDR